MTRWPGGGGIGFPVELTSGVGGGAGLSPNVGDAEGPGLTGPKGRGR